MASMNDRVRRLLEHIPGVPGIYLMKDSKGGVLYVGKAIHLRNRVRSYFTQKTASPKIEVLRQKIDNIEYIETPTEIEALLLEAQLIATYSPRYNTLLKDDKSYPLLKITKEAYPRVCIARSKKEGRGTFYGPYTDASLLREAVNIINTIFPIRKCITLPKSPCLYYHLHQCLAPCVRKNIQVEYNAVITDIKEFLQGAKKNFIEYLSSRMQEAARNYRFEEAALFKRQIAALQKLKKRKYHIEDPSRYIKLSASYELKKILSLKKIPEKIVCFDVSNIQGCFAVASKVSFFREVPEKKQYRKYNIQSVYQIDDYAMIREVCSRMLDGLKSGEDSFVPDLIVIDGGKGHLASAHTVLTHYGYAYIPCIAIAKKFEDIYCIHKQTAIKLPDDSAALNLLKRIRDEAHRFAITYHRTMRNKQLRVSALDAVHGIGERKKQALLKHFGSVEQLAKATVDELCEVPGINNILARNIRELLSRQQLGD